jgi:hypothetical protein
MKQKIENWELRREKWNKRMKIGNREEKMEQKIKNWELDNSH